MTRTRFSLTVLALGLLTACGGNQLPTAVNYPVVVGHVFDAVTRAPIAGAQIVVATIDTATSGSDGSYRVPNVPVGSNTLQASAPGYASFTNNFSVVAGQTATIDIALTKQ